MPQAENIVSMSSYRRARGNSDQFSQREKTLTDIRRELSQRLRPCPHHDGSLKAAVEVQDWVIHALRVYREVLA